MNKTIPVITIDGPGSSGKGTVGQLLARKLKWHFLDSGILYRVLALAAVRHDIPLDDETALAAYALAMDVKFKESKPELVTLVTLDHDDVTQMIRGTECGNNASKIGALPKVRTALLERQRQFRQLPGLVTDGRDMGSVVFPDAQLKIFLEASAEERARRRYYQLKEKGINVSLDALCAELVERDRRDRERAAAPLKAAPDAMIIDTTQLTIESVLQQILAEVDKIFKR